MIDLRGSMRSRICAAAFVLALAAALAPQTRAGAQDEDAAITEAARRRFQEGVRLFYKDKYEEARAAFLQAYALKHHPAVLLNLAQSELRSNHPVDAARHFSAFLRDSTAATGPERAEAENALSQLRTKLGRVQIAVNVAGATILVDNEQVGESPLAEPVDVAPGSHTVQARLGSRTQTAEVSVGAGKHATTSLELKGEEGGASSETAASARPPSPPPPPAPEAARPSPRPESRRIAPAPATTEKESSEGFFGWLTDSPVAWVGLGLTGAGIATLAFGSITAVMANQNVDAVAAKLEAHRQQVSPTRLNVCAGPMVPEFEQYCAQLRKNLDVRGEDVAIAVIGGAVAAAGVIELVVGYSLSPSKKSAQHADPKAFVVTPWANSHLMGVGVHGAF
jgi:hypothetical protein